MLKSVKRAGSEIGKNRAKGEPDFWILLLTVALVIFGNVMVFSASYYNSLSVGGSMYYYLIRDMIWSVSGFILMTFFANFDYHNLQSLTKVFLAICIGLCVIVLTPAGTTVSGGQRWISLGPASIMPGEFAKLGVILFTAQYLADDSEKKATTLKGMAPVFGVMLVFMAMIYKQPNLSTALTVGVIAVGMLFLCGFPLKILGGLVVLGAVGMAGIVAKGGYQARRITGFLDPFENAADNGYQVVQSLLALGTGGLKGLGIGKSIQKNLYLPEPQTDFIMAIIGEELGLIGTLGILVLYLLLIWRIALCAARAKDTYGFLLAGGIDVMLGIQVAFNIMVVTASMPPTGVALPFISYGGNSLWIMMTSMGIVLSVSRQARKPVPAISSRRVSAAEGSGSETRPYAAAAGNRSERPRRVRGSAGAGRSSEGSRTSGSYMDRPSPSEMRKNRKKSSYTAMHDRKTLPERERLWDPDERSGRR